MEEPKETKIIRIENKAIEELINKNQKGEEMTQEELNKLWDYL